MAARTERRHLPSRIPEIRSLVPALRAIAEGRRAVPLLYLEITGLEGLRVNAKRAALRACKRAVASALAESAGSVLRRGDAVAAGPNAAWFIALLLGRAVDRAPSSVAAPDVDLVVAAARLQRTVLSAFLDKRESDAIPARAGVRVGWTIVEPSNPSDVLAELRHAIQGAAVVARVEERRAAFLASVTHELRTPLTAIIGYAERLQTAGRTPASKLKRDLNVIESEGRRLARLVEGLIDAGAWGAGSLHLHVEFSNVGEFADAAWAAVAPRLVSRSIAYSRTGDATGLVDRERLLQIMINLLDNAARHASTSVTVGISVRGGHMRISVADDGAGFSAEELRNFARPFAVGPLGHLGLGLSIARLLVDAHGGSMRASARLGGGAAVVVTLPRDADSKRRPPRLKPQER